MTIAASGWHVDPYGRFQYRYFDGQRWTEHVASHGQVGIDPAFAAVPAPRRPARKAHRGGSITAVVGALAVVAAAFMPWVRIWRVETNGIEADGRLTLALAIIGGAFAVAAAVRAPALIHVGTLIGGSLIAAIGIFDLDNVQSHAIAEVGHGLWATIAGAGVMVIGGVVGLAKSRTD